MSPAGLWGRPLQGKRFRSTLTGIVRPNVVESTGPLKARAFRLSRPSCSYASFTQTHSCGPALAAQSPISNSRSAAMSDDLFLQTQGDQFITRAGDVVKLHGVGLGGWLNMENFIVGFPATE